MITKSDFLVFMDAPIHFWAYQHEKAKVPSPSLFDQHLFEQGKKAEALAKKYIYSKVISRYQNAEILWQPTYTTDHFEVRADAIIHDLDTDVFDLYEIKGSSKIKPEHKYDITFQAIVCDEHIKLRNHFILHIDKEYVRQGDIEIENLFTIVNVNDIVNELGKEVEDLASQASAVSASKSPDNLESCYKPKDCVCLDICHPELSEKSIYDINGIRINKKQVLRSQSIDQIVDIPASFNLPLGQTRQIQATKKMEVLIFGDEIRTELDHLEFPLFFLDYEAFNPSIPYFDGYKPYQFIPFQYSLHIIEKPDGKLRHHEFIDFDEGDPGIRMMDDLQNKIDIKGSIVVWNRAFEQSRHREMAERYPQYSEMLLDWNERIFDLMVPFQKGMYVDPAAKGSYSIKNILPAVIPGKSYAQLELSDGTEAMLLWDRIVRGQVAEIEIPKARKRLLDYCELDTLAMVEIWRFLQNITK